MFGKLLLILLFPLIIEARTIRVALIDTGYDFNSKWNFNNANENSIINQNNLKPVKLCKTWHKDFLRDVNDKDYLQDAHGHGTHIAGIIAKHATISDYCIIVITTFYTGMTKLKKRKNIDNTYDAFKYAIEQKVDVINYSGGGAGSYDEKEKEIVNKAINEGITVIVAAGNEKLKLEHEAISLTPEEQKKQKIYCNYYPACYNKKIIRVGNLEKEKLINSSSNYGNAISIWRIGTGVTSLLPNNSYGDMTGTSMSCGVVTGEFVRALNREYNGY